MLRESHARHGWLALVLIASAGCPGERNPVRPQSIDPREAEILSMLKRGDPVFALGTDSAFAVENTSPAIFEALGVQIDGSNVIVLVDDTERKASLTWVSNGRKLIEAALDLRAKNQLVLVDRQSAGCGEPVPCDACVADGNFDAAEKPIDALWCSPSPDPRKTCREKFEPVCKVQLHTKGKHCKAPVGDPFEETGYRCRN